MMAGESPNSGQAAIDRFTRERYLIEGGAYASLTATQVRVLLPCLIASNFETGEFYSSIATIARQAGISSLSRARKAIRGLEKAGVLEVVEASRGRNTTTRKVSDKPGRNCTGFKSVPGPKCTGSKTDTPTGSLLSATGSKTHSQPGPKCTPQHIRTNKGTNKRTHTRAADAAGRVSDDEAIYLVYPRHVGKAAALKAIAKALKTVAQRPGIDPQKFLIDRTTAFAKCRNDVIGMDPEQARFTPHPATWFNRGSYDDDATDWAPPQPDGFPPRRNSTPQDFIDAGIPVVAHNGAGRRIGQIVEGLNASR